MKKSISYLLLSGMVTCASCESRWSIHDKSGALGKTNGPVETTIKLNQRQLTAAHEGRLGLTEQPSGTAGERLIPVQWDTLNPNSRSIAVMMIPSGIPGNRRFVLSESKTSFGVAMQANEDPASGQFIMSDNGKPVLRYNYNTVFEKDAIDTLSANRYIVTPNDTFMANPSIYAVPRSNYIHPLYGLDGELLTRDWSKDHPHHRGIYWAWPEVKFGEKMGDLHALQKVFARPTGKIKLQNGPVFAQIEAENLWMWEDHLSIVQEVAVIRAYRTTTQGRIIDLAFRFIALKDSISIARRDTKLYGGLNVRMQTPKQQEISVFTDSANMQPRRVWSDLSGIFVGADTTSGLMVLQHQQNPDYPGDWIQYPELSWCQPTFPASGSRYKLEPGKPLVLCYRLIIHSGIKPNKDLSEMLWDTFNSEVTSRLVFTIPEMEPMKQP